MNTLITVIIPAYNAEKYISRAIDSVLKQTHEAIELIVVDDGSIDRTARIVKSYGDKVNYVHQENKGVAAARNRGIENSKGDYIGFLDSDDYILPNMYKKLLYAIDYNNLDMAMCDFLLENENGERVKALDLKKCILDLAEPRDMERGFKYLGNSSCNKLYRRLLIEKIRFPNYKRGEDALFALECLLNSKRIGFLSEALYVYFQNSNSVTKSNIDLNVIDNYKKVHAEKRNLIKEYNKMDILNIVLKDFYVKRFLMYTNAIRMLKDNVNKEIFWKEWLSINKNDFLIDTSLAYTIMVSKNINWVYYCGMLSTGKFLKPMLKRTKNLKFYFNYSAIIK